MKLSSISNRDKLLVIKLLYEFKHPKSRIRSAERLSTVKEYIATGKTYVFTVSGTTGNIEPT